MSSETRLFLTRAGKTGEDEHYALENNLAVIGFREIPSLETAKSYEDIKSIVEKAMPNGPAGAIKNYSGQLWCFVLGMKNDDLAAMPRKATSQIAFGSVSGGYRYQKINGEMRHTRPVKWAKTDIPRTAFQQDLLHSFGAFMTVCQVQRNDAVQRVLSVLNGGKDFASGVVPSSSSKTAATDSPVEVQSEEQTDYAELCRDQIAKFVIRQFKGHALTDLVDAVLKADGWITKPSDKGPDGGVDILAGRGLLGLDAPRLAVQVKSQETAADVTVYRTLQGAMQSFKAEQGLLVCWGGFNQPVERESRQGHFSVRLWGKNELLDAIFSLYPKLPEDIQARLPLKQGWMLVNEADAMAE